MKRNRLNYFNYLSVVLSIDVKMKVGIDVYYKTAIEVYKHYKNVLELGEKLTSGSYHTMFLLRNFN